MMQTGILEAEARASVLNWAAERRIALSVSLLREGQWSTLRSQMLGWDARDGVLMILSPMAGIAGTALEIAPGDPLGISFRRGHKKCVFVGIAVIRRREEIESLGNVDVVVVRGPTQMRELQRRAYQRVMVPEDRLVAVRLWQTGLPSGDGTNWPICSGRLANVSAGGLLADIRDDQNPRLSVGELIGVEITRHPSRQPLLLEAQYRHCCVSGEGRIGLGLQLIGLEHEVAGRSSLLEVADFVREMQVNSKAACRRRPGGAVVAGGSAGIAEHDD